MTYIIFSFDTEDYINPIGAEGILRSAELLRKAGVKGCFNTVGLLAKALVDRERQDVLDALKHHEIELHAYTHSMHPTINEYTDLEDFDEAKALFLEQEKEGARIIREIMGVDHFPAACPPGSSSSYVAHYGYAEMGVNICCGDSVYDVERGRPVHCCNLAALQYRYFLDRYLLQASYEEIDTLLEEFAAPRDVVIFGHHPQMSYLKEFWDGLNYKGTNTPKSEWKLSERMDPADTEHFYEKFTYLVEKLQSDPRFEIVTYGQIADMYCSEERKLTPDQLPAIYAQLQEDFFPVTTPDSYCLSDIFLAAKDFLLGKQEHVCDTVYGFLSEPIATAPGITVTLEEMAASAAEIPNGFLPPQITVGAHMISPAQWLMAALELLCGKETAEIKPQHWQIDLDQFPNLRDLNYAGTWIHSPEFKDQYLSDRYRMQTWTFRLPKDTYRKIF